MPVAVESSKKKIRTVPLKTAKTSTIHKEVTLKNGRKIGHIGVVAFGDLFPKIIEIKKVFLAEKNPVVKLGLVIK